MRRQIAVCLLVLAVSIFGARWISAAAQSSGSCQIGGDGGAVFCGGSFLITEPGQPARPGRPSLHATAAPTNGSPSQTSVRQTAPPTSFTPPCLQLGPSTPLRIAPGAGSIASLTCPTAPPPPTASAAPQVAAALGAPGLDPGVLAVQFWQTIPLPVPHPSIPPGYAVTGMPAYLVTNGTIAPPPYQHQTPLGPLSITAHGSYMVDWNDGTLPTWTGPYLQEGRPYPNGNISHTYDNVGTVTVTVQEIWSATWRLGAASGQLTALRTTATIPDFTIKQIQSILTG